LQNKFTTWVCRRFLGLHTRPNLDSSGVPTDSSNPFQVDLDPFSLKPELHALYSQAGVCRVLFVKKLHQEHVQMRFFTALFALVVDAGAVESQKLTLSTHGEFSFSGFQSISKL